MCNLLAVLSTSTAVTTIGRTGAAAGIGTVMSAGSATAAMSPIAVVPTLGFSVRFSFCDLHLAS